VSYVATKEAVHCLVNLRADRLIHLPSHHYLTTFAILPNGVLVARDARTESLVRVADGRKPIPLVRSKQLRATLIKRGALPADVDKIHVWRPVTSPGCRYLALELGIDRFVSDDWIYEAAVAIYDAEDLTIPIKLFRTPRQSLLLATRFVADGDSAFRIISGSRRDPVMPPAPLVVRSRRWGMGEPFLLEPDGELVEGDYPSGVVVAMMTPDIGWAGAGGSLYSLDFASKTTRVVASDSNDDVRWVDVLAD
jgi:hypothetical protein